MKNVITYQKIYVNTQKLKQTSLIISSVEPLVNFLIANFVPEFLYSTTRTKENAPEPIMEGFLKS